MKRALAFFLGLFAFSAFASAQIGDVAFSVGYAHIYPQQDGGLSFSKDGAYVDGDFAWRVPGQLPLMFGFGINAAGTYNYQNYSFVTFNNFVGYTNIYSDVDNFSFEPRVALRFRVPAIPGLEIRPRFGFGPLYNYYAVDVPQTFNNTLFINTFYHSGAAFEIRPDLQIGYGWGGASVGLDVSYMAAWGSFGALGDQQQQLEAGIYFRFKY